MAKTVQKQTVEEFDRDIAIEELIKVSDEAAQAGAHLFKIGAITQTAFEELRKRFKSADEVPGNMPTILIRKQAKDLRTVIEDFASRYEAANRILEAREQAKPKRKAVKR